MSLVLVYDTETTGFPDFKAPSEAPHQPHIVDICGLLFDEDSRELVDSFEAMVKPDGWAIPTEVAAIHGITEERAMAEGIDEMEALEGFRALYSRAASRIAHNESFDARIVRIAYRRMWDEAEADRWSSRHYAFCTCNAAKPIVNLPPTPKMVARGMRGPKPPSLAEAVSHFFGETLSNAHRARPDAEACARVYWALLDTQRKTA